ncbi:MAG: hypothetical protein ACRETL_09975, partial [Gammaproteobacteria bacterium]
MGVFKFLLVSGLVVAWVAANACDLVAVPIAGSIGKVGDVTLAFGRADDAQHPKAWLGPLKIS